MTALAAVLAGVLGLLVGVPVNRAAGRFPWPPRGAGVPDAVPGGGVAVRSVAVRPPVVEAGTGALFALVGLRFGLSWELPAFLFLAGVAVLLAVIDLQHHLLPDRVVLPSLAVAAVLLLLPAVAEPDGVSYRRAVLGAAVLFVVFLAMALISPGGLGMGDVKLAGLVGLYLGWLGWDVLLRGAVAGFVVQALLALVLLAGRRIGLRGELPFGPAMLLGAALAIGWSALAG